jgi:hypothetical protein
MEKLTGRTRHRHGRKWFSTVLVMQVEVIGSYESSQDFHFGPEYTYWRDAKVEDLSTLFVMELK